MISAERIRELFKQQTDLDFDEIDGEIIGLARAIESEVLAQLTANSERAAEPVAEKEKAPVHHLPDWGDCDLIIKNYQFTKHGKEPTQLHRFIHEYDDADSYRSGWFMHRLELVIQEAYRTFTSPQASQQPVDQWQPIETAPKDGTRILIISMRAETPEKSISVATWKGEDNEWWAGGYIQCWATHWMSLPATPTNKADGE